MLNEDKAAEALLGRRCWNVSLLVLLVEIAVENQTIHLLLSEWAG